jgi:hypothetical protein
MSEVGTSAFDPRLRPRDTKQAPERQQPVQLMPDWQDRFLAILGNHAKLDPTYRDWPLRRSGFVVLARGTTNLAAVQELCHGQRAHAWNQCLTARYRVDDAGPVFGTAFYGLTSDLVRLAEDDGADLIGDLRADSSAMTWGPLARAIPAELIERYRQLLAAPGGGAPTIPGSAIRAAIEALGSSTLIRTGIRVVVLVEATSANANPLEWRAALDQLLRGLPERFGLVLSGAPDELALPTNDPHYLEIDLSTEPEAVAEPVGTSLRYTPAALTSDRPAEVDTLGLNPYAVALARLVLHRQTKAPLTIGVQAPWGKGKSTFMGFVEQALRQQAIDVSSNVDRGTEPADWPRWRRYLAARRYRRLWKVHGRSRPGDPKLARADAAIAAESVVTVFFNAWRFQDAQQIWAGLAQEISDSLERSLTRWQRLRLRLSYGWRYRRSQLRWTIPALFAVAVLGLALALGLPDAASDQSAGEQLLRILLPVGSALLVAALVVGRAYRAAAPVTERLADYLRRPNYAAAMGYQHVVLEDLRFVANAVRELRPRCRFVVFVDDLDRCSDDRIMEVLQAIHLLLGDSDFFAFLGIDSEMIYRAIRRHYGGKEGAAPAATSGERSDGGNPLPARFPESYLSKIIQLSFYLPDAGDDQTATYLSGMFSETARTEYANSKDTQTTVDDQAPTAGDYLFAVVPSGVVPTRPVRWQDVEDTGDELGAFLDFLGRGSGNPRELKRLINVHRLVKIVLQRPGSWSGPRQRRLVLWLIICSIWPDLADEVITHADRHPDAPDCLDPVAAAASENDPELAELLLARGAADVLPAADLAEQGELRLAAEVCHLVRLGVPPPAPGPAVADPTAGGVSPDPDTAAPSGSGPSPGPAGAAQGTWTAPAPASATPPTTPIG